MQKMVIVTQYSSCYLCEDEWQTRSQPLVWTCAVKKPWHNSIRTEMRCRRDSYGGKKKNPYGCVQQYTKGQEVCGGINQSQDLKRHLFMTKIPTFYLKVPVSGHTRDWKGRIRFGVISFKAIPFSGQLKPWLPRTKMIGGEDYGDYYGAYCSPIRLGHEWLLVDNCIINIYWWSRCYLKHGNESQKWPELIFSQMRRQPIARPIMIRKLPPRQAVTLSCTEMKHSSNILNPNK